MEKQVKEYYISREQYLTVKATWKETTHGADTHIIYNVLRSKPIDLGFTERKKGIQNNDPWFSFKEALRTARWIVSSKPELFKAVFGIEVPKDLIYRLMK